MPIITLTSDFGLKDSFPGVLKGVIWRICPEAQIADITHSIEPQNVLEGALTLARVVPYFPAGTIHVAVIDPSVGTRRRPLAARIGWYLFVGPDNGLFTPIYEEAEKHDWLMEIVELTNPRYWLANVSHTFHGRDVFAPVAAHLANGDPLTDMGRLIKDPVRLNLPRPLKTPTGWTAHVLICDHFGNLATDLMAASIKRPENLFIRIAGREIRGLVASYASREPGDLIALADSDGRLEVAVVDGSAAETLAVRVGDPVEVSEEE
jgi:S-adenosylmethionine hydrolase